MYICLFNILIFVLFSHTEPSVHLEEEKEEPIFLNAEPGKKRHLPLLTFPILGN